MQRILGLTILHSLLLSSNLRNTLIIKQVGPFRSDLFSLQPIRCRHPPGQVPIPQGGNHDDFLPAANPDTLDETLKQNHLPREPLLEWSVGHVGVEGADFSPHLPHQPSFQRTQRHMGVEGDFGLPIYVFRCVTSGSSEATLAGIESGGEVERSGCERVAPTMMAKGDGSNGRLR